MAANPPHKVTHATRARVESLVSFGITHENIAEALDISNDTLGRHYKKELKAGAIHANEKVAKRLFEKATEQDDFQAQKFWLQCRANWKVAETDSSIPAESLVAKLLEKI